jgi:hypothetical protein
VDFWPPESDDDVDLFVKFFVHMRISNANPRIMREYREFELCELVINAFA